MLPVPQENSSERAPEDPSESPMTRSYESEGDAASAYIQAFFHPSVRKKPFIAYWQLEMVQDVCKHSAADWITREVFLGAAVRALPRLRKALGLQTTRGIRVAHLMSANRREDAILRLSAAIAGHSIVTINWDADTFDRIKYKVESTNCMAVIHDDYVSPQVIDRLVHSIKTVDVHAVPSKCLVLPSDFPTEEQCLPAYNEKTEELIMSQGGSPLPKRTERIIVFTSGTTSKPKGVRLTYGNMEASAKCILDCLGTSGDVPMDFIIVNPLHHVNSTAILETAMRCPNARVHLIDRFRTVYWKLLCHAATLARTAAGFAPSASGSSSSSSSAPPPIVSSGEAKPADSYRVVAPLVSRHIEFLQNAIQTGRLGDKSFLTTLKDTLKPKEVVLLLGSAPVGPSTVDVLQRFIGKLPTVRFGSTETSLQVAATPYCMPDQIKNRTLRRGWNHSYGGKPVKGYYIGRPHEGLTEMNIVRSVTESDPLYMVPAEEGEPGFMVCRGQNCMWGYANTDNQPFSSDGWYLGFGDFGFWLTSDRDGQRDYYWTHRAADLIIKGGANYSCQQIAEDVLNFIGNEYHLPIDQTQVAVVGVKWRSEHDDDTCVTIELPERHQNMQSILESELVRTAANSDSLCKASRPDFVRFDSIPRTFKGAVDIGTLREDCLEYLELRKSRLNYLNNRTTTQIPN